MTGNLQATAIELRPLQFQENADQPCASFRPQIRPIYAPNIMAAAVEPTSFADTSA
jgi:hypothetical protein